MKKINLRKIFCFISIIFIGGCLIFYGTRFIKLYLENKGIEINEKNSLSKVIKKNNTENENFKSINGNNYFINDEKNNYLNYSNIIWRIIKINSDNSITAISDHALTSLAYGKSLSFVDSFVYSWMNKNSDDSSGILENSLNEINTYLQKTPICLDKIDELNNNACKSINNDHYFSLLSVVDYVNAGSSDSYLINDEYFYLENSNNENGIWNIDEDGKISTSTGIDIEGIRPVITLKANIDYVSGDGSESKPYQIESSNGLFGSYVSLDNELWRIYQVNDTEVRLMLNDYLKVNNNNLSYIYSNINSYYNDTKNGSMAYYLNNTFLNSLSYKDKIKEVSWSNGYYNVSDNYDYKTSLETTIDSKVATISIGDIFLNDELKDYFTMTGSGKNGSMIYTIKQNKKTYQKQINQKMYIVPTISLDKSLLKNGQGSKDDPYEME